MGTITPSKYTRLDALIEMRQNNYLGKDGKDYCQVAVDDLISEKQTKLDERIEKEREIEEIKGQRKKAKLLKLVQLTKEHSHLLRPDTLTNFVNDIKSEVQLLSVL